MLNMKNYAAPDSLQEAWSLYNTSPSNVILGGCAFLRLGNKRIGTGIDLCKLELDYVKEHEAFIEIGSMTKLRELETNKLIAFHFGDALKNSVESIVGVSFRNSATIGGSVFGRYGFSDVITALLSLNTEIEMYKGGHMTLKRYLNAPPKFDILVAIRIPKSDKCQCHYEAIRHSAGDFPILTSGVSLTDQGLVISIGARPMRATRAENTMKYLNKYLSSKEILTNEIIENAAVMASEELTFGSNMRAQAEYRKHLCKVLVERGIREVSNGN